MRGQLLCREYALLYAERAVLARHFYMLLLYIYSGGRRLTFEMRLFFKAFCARKHNIVLVGRGFGLFVCTPICGPPHVSQGILAHTTTHTHHIYE